MNKTIFRLSQKLLSTADLSNISLARYCFNIHTSNMVSSEVKHLKQGDAQPALKKGVLRLYSMRFCPYAQRVHLVLDAKKIKYDTVNVDLTQKPDWIFKKSPKGKVPAIEFEDGETLHESLIVSDYLDEVYPERPLYPKDPLKKAQDKLLMEQFNRVINNFFKMFMFADKFNSETMEEIRLGLDLLETEIKARKTPFLGGDKPGMVDLMIWPWCERADILKILGGELYMLPKERFPKILEWRENMIKDDAVKASYIDPEHHAKYFRSRASGYPDYDMLVNKL